MYVFINDRLIPASDASVSVFDHGFLYGDGVYETMRSYSGVVYMLEEHLARLCRSAAMIELRLPLAAASIKAAIHLALNANSLKDAYVRLTVSRGSGAIGLDPELCKQPTFIVITEPFKPYPEMFYKDGVKTVIANTRRNLKEAINPQIKSLNFLNNILARIEAKQRNALEALMLNSEGDLAEGTISNIFFFRDNKLCTPSVACGILDGITRGLVIEQAKGKGLTVDEGFFQKEDIYSASEVFITNTTMEVMPVCSVDDVKFKTGEVSKLLHNEYLKGVNAYLEQQGRHL